MKRILSLILASAMCIACLTACGGDSSSADSEETTKSSSISLDEKAEWNEKDAIERAIEQAQKEISNYSFGDYGNGELGSLTITEINIINGSCEEGTVQEHENGGTFNCYKISVTGNYNFNDKYGYNHTQKYSHSFYIHSDKTEHDYKTEHYVKKIR